MEKAYARHRPSEEGAQKIEWLRTAFSELHGLIEQECPQSRETSLALTNLEQAAMWATKAVTHNDPASQVEW